MKKLVLLLCLVSTLEAGDSCSGWGSFEVGADWLYWKAFQDNLEYGAEVDLVATNTLESVPLSPNFNPNSGFRVFVDYGNCFDPCSWHVGAIFTRLSGAFNAHHATGGGDINTHFIVLNSQSFPVFNAVTSNGFQFSSLDSAWSYAVNYLDLDISHNFALYPGFEINPHLGLRGMWIKEKLRLDGISPSNGGATFFSNFTEYYDGYGLEGGLHAHWHLGKGFSLLGHLGGSLLYAHIHVDEGLTIVPAADAPLTLNVGDTIYHLSPTLDGFIGVQYEGCWGCYPIHLHLGWEQHLIMNINHFSIFNYADLTLQGLTLGGSVLF